MTLIKAEHPEHGIWYFTSISKAAKYIGCVYACVNQQLHGVTKQTKGWKIEWTEDENIINKYINPEK